ncbi:MAG: molybdopterin-dependent oxidoreductase [Chloroflexi bacterium]|nr:molybdopterin-dependent oxidoreductase [Chloroflexota bacterium]
MAKTVPVPERPAAIEDVWVPSVCDGCRSFCGIKAHRVNGVVVKLEGDAGNPANLGRMCAKGQAALMSAYDPSRPAVPLKRTNPQKGIGVDPKWVEISWDKALDTVAQRLRKIREEDSRKLLIHSFDRSVAKFVRTWANAFGTPNHHWGGYYCGNALHPSTYLTVATHQQEIDLDYCNYCVLIGNQMGFMAGVNPNSLSIKMAEARMRGMKVVVVDPVGTNASMKASEWVPIRPGTDAAFALALVNQLINELNLYDAPFLRARTNAAFLVGPDGYYGRDKASGKPLVWDPQAGAARPYDAGVAQPALEGEFVVDGVPCHTAFQLLKEHVRAYTPERAAQITTVPAETIRRIAQEYGTAACIGANITIEGMELPYRPAAAVFFRGAVAHKHGTHHGLAIQLLNMVVGNMFVVGGYRALNIVGPGWTGAGAREDYSGVSYFAAVKIPWGPGASADGYIMPIPPLGERQPYPPEEVHAPDDLGLLALYPVATNISPQVQLSILDPHKFTIPYETEMLIHCRANHMTTKATPELSAEALRRIPFQVSLGPELDETAEFADIFLPDRHALERLDPFPQSTNSNMAAATGFWYWTLRQPVKEALGQTRHWIEVLFELAERAGFLGDLNQVLNVALHLSPEHRLDLKQRYSLEQVGDRLAQTQFGPGHSLAWFKKEGYLKFKRRAIEAYPGPYIQGRHPVYFEHLKRLGEKVKAVADELEIPWDVSDYQPLPEWKPCPDYEASSPDYDLLAVNYKSPFHSLSVTAQNPWLNELSQHHAYVYKVMVNRDTAHRKGLKDGDLVEVESAGGKTRARVKVTECIHPEVVGLAGGFGNWARGRPVAQGQGPHFNSLIPLDTKRMDYVSTAVDACIRVKLTKVTP